MALKSVSIGENGSGLTASVTGYTLKTKLCDNDNNSKCTLNATKTMYVTVEKISGTNKNYNIRLDFDYKRVYDIIYQNMSNTGYPSTILTGDDMTVLFSSDNTNNGTATYVYTSNTLTVNSYTSTISSNFTVTGNSTYTYNNGTLSIINVTNDITITKENSSTSYAANTILSLVDGYSNSSTNIINLGTGTGNCTKTLAYDGTADNNLRYIGTNPCNYVNFNGQEWRIIGVFNNVSVVGENEPQTLLKLITATDYGSTTLWDSGNKNIWGSSSLYTTLNGTYYTSNLNSSSYVANVMWSLGASPNASISASQFYAAEHGTVVPSGATSQYAGYVGIMHASDYGFATSGDMDNSTRGDCISGTLNSSRDWTSSCYNYDWLSYANTMWTINPRSGANNQAYRVSYNILNYATVGGTYSKATVRPVIFLKSNVKIDSGDGSSGSGAYQLSQ